VFYPASLEVVNHTEAPVWPCARSLFPRFFSVSSVALRRILSRFPPADRKIIWPRAGSERFRKFHRRTNVVYGATSVYELSPAPRIHNFHRDSHRTVPAADRATRRFYNPRGKRVRAYLFSLVPRRLRPYSFPRARLTVSLRLSHVLSPRIRLGGAFGFGKRDCSSEIRRCHERFRSLNRSN